MDVVYLLGRILFAMIFIGSGFGHLTQLDATAQYAQSKGVPAPKLMTAVTGLMMLAGGFSVMLGFWMEIGTWLIVIFLLPAAFIMHNFWTVQDPMQKQMEMAHFMKDLSMAGAALILYWVIQTSGYGPFTIGLGM
jgi:uncharacterized membrane protein YphA (DoxX/SURF4 family)